MDYLIKDLANLTGITPARIRKWQERFQIFEPKCAENGYWYYSSKDLFILKNIIKLLEKGEPLVQIMNKGRSFLLDIPSEDNHFNPMERKIIQAISTNDLNTLEEEINKKKSESFEAWLNRLSNTLILVGEAWSRNLLSIADEHFFTRWLQGTFLEFIRKYENNGKVNGLIVSYPGDDHVTGALLHYGRLIYKKKVIRFCGMLPEEELFRELAGGGYSELFISITIPRDLEEISKLVNKLNGRFKSLKIHVGGYGVVQIAKNNKNK